MIIKIIKPEETYPLRLEVLKTSKDYIYKYRGDFNDTTIHFSLFEKDKCAGIVSLMEISNPLFKERQMQLRGMAVSVDFQSKGVGSRLIEKSVSYCQENNIGVVWCNARENAVDFYKNHGFNIIGDKFFIEHVCFHYLMYKEI